ncbi:monocarboxylate transporter 13-like [Acanthaster planci]|uniref:Monocarboxylate transporter 13-like n=1 Tax=Acanthaster planci TaxID=133434 RepID=A0A8B7Y8N9_ACAPL|nr:monocarboxylate transporter 13-like [Acanthaster planci]
MPEPGSAVTNGGEKLPFNHQSEALHRKIPFFNKGWGRRGYRRAWMICLAGFILDIPFMGMVMSFGELLLPLLDTFGGGTAAISWVGSIAFGMAYVGNPISTPLYHRFGCRRVSLVGVALGAIALFLCSFVTEFWWMFATYSLMFGFATNLCYNPPLVLTGAWFPVKNHVLATCVLVAGIPFGSLVMNPVCQSLVETVGLRNTYRVLAALALVIGIPCCLIFKQPPLEEEDDTRSLEGSIESTEVDGEWLSEMIKQEKEPAIRKIFGVRVSLWLDPVYILYMFGQLFKGIGYVFPFIHLVRFMDTIGIEPSTGAIIMTVKGAADMVGRFSAGVMGEKLPFPLIHMYVICTGVMAIATYLCTFAASFIAMFFYALTIGFFNGVFNALVFSTTTSLFDRDSAKEAWSFCQVPPGVAIIIGPGIAGLVYDLSKSYIVDFYVNTAVFEVAMLTFLLVPGVQLCRRLRSSRAGEGGDDGKSSNIMEMSQLERQRKRLANGYQAMN